MSEGVTISWVDLEVRAPLSRTERVKNKDEGVSMDDKVIIQKNSGFIRPGEFTAILGPSGCGKTTFMNFLTKRKYFMHSLTYTGKAYMNGHDIDGIDFNTGCGYVMQDDIIQPIYTVREVLEFTAEMRLHQDTWKNQVERVIKDLSLKSCEHTIIGNELEKGISGGERKRTSIGIELLSNPLVLFLDEPTTGLDSHNAETLIDTLNTLAKNYNKTIVAILHQPNSIMFSKFENFILMGMGRIFYNGKAADAVNYFAEKGYKCPKFTNPAEFFIELVTVDPLIPNKLNELYDNLDHEEPPARQETELPDFEKHYPYNPIKQTLLLGKRVVLNFQRNIVIFYGRLGAHLFYIIMSFLSFYQVAGENEDNASVLDRAGTMSFVLIVTSFIAIMTSSAYADEKAMFIREQCSNTYGALPYYLSKMIYGSPPDVMMTVMLAVGAYFVIGLSLDHWEQIFVFVMLAVGINLTSAGMGNFLIMAISNLDVALQIAPFIGILQFLMSGQLINFDDIPPYLIWMEYSSPLKYAFSAAILNEFDTFNEDYCGNYRVCDAPDYYSLDGTRWTNIGVLYGMVFFIHFMAYLAVFNLARSLRS